MSQTDVTNPGLVNVADQGDGYTSVDQAVAASLVPCEVVPLTQAALYEPGQGPVAVDQPIIVGPAQTAQVTVSGDSESSVRGNIEDVTENTVASQTYGSTAFSPNVFV